MPMHYHLNYFRYFISTSVFQEALAEYYEGVPVKQEIVNITDINVASLRAVI
jgi:hypothetical protein